MDYGGRVVAEPVYPLVSLDLCRSAGRSEIDEADEIESKSGDFPILTHPNSSYKLNPPQGSKLKYLPTLEHICIFNILS